MSKPLYALMAVGLALHLLILVGTLAPDWWRVGNLLLVVVFAYLLGQDKE